MAKAINLESYWLPILRNLYEFKQIAIAEEPELRYILEAIDRTIANMFISTADEYGISRFESILGIYPEADATLESRRFAVLLKWNSYIPYTYNELYRQLVALCGEGNFAIEQDFNKYFIKITTSLGTVGSFDQVLALLKKMLPCNLVLELENSIYGDTSTTIYTGGMCCTALCYTITNDINVTDEINENINLGIGVSEGSTTVITNDIDSVAEESSNANVAMPLSTATVITINE